MAKSVQKLIALFGAVLTMLTAILSVVSLKHVTAFAAEKSIVESSVSDDLRDIDILRYPKNPNGRVELIRFMEYCYSERAFLADSYGLYFYLYNPTENELRTEAIANTVEMGTSYGADGKPTDYNGLALTFVNCTDNYRFYKFRLTSPLLILQREKTYAAENEGKRRYDISGIQIWFSGDETPTDFSVSYSYFWTGYAAGCGMNSNSGSTLACEGDNLITLDIPLYHNNTDGKQIEQQSYYRTDRSSLGANHRWQIDSVYFSIDEDSLFEESGESLGILQRIKAKWYEYQTKKIFVTASKELKNALTDYIGVDIGNLTKEELMNDLGFGFGSLLNVVQGYETKQVNWNWGYGLVDSFRENTFNDQDTYYNNLREEDRLSQLDWLLEGKDSGKNTITTDELWNYARDYSAKFGISKTDEYLAMLGLSDSLFTGTTAVHGDNYEAKRGENIREFDSEAAFDLRSYDSTLSDWDRFLNFWYGVDNGSTWEIQDLSPIEEVTADKISNLISDVQLAENLKLSESDISEFRTWASAELANGKKVYLFRFAVTDYLTEQLYVERYVAGKGAPSASNYPVSYGQEAVFFGFEMITVTYNNRGNLTVIPVVQSPINVFDNIDVTIHDGNKPQLWQIILAVVFFVLVCIAVYKLVKGLFVLITGR